MQTNSFYRRQLLKPLETKKEQRNALVENYNNNNNFIGTLN